MTEDGMFSGKYVKDSGGVVVRTWRMDEARPTLFSNTKEAYSHL